MKKTMTLALAATLLLGSCVSRKKYNTLKAEKENVAQNEQRCGVRLAASETEAAALKAENARLKQETDYLKQNSNKVLGALQDMSVISGKQAESIRQSLENITQKETYIRQLQSAISRKDSLNMVLVVNLKKYLEDVNDQDITIKVDKGVVYIDISDKMLFNTGQFKVTESARKVLGKVARVLNGYPEIEFMVEGHTDSVPIFNACMEDNWDLSVKRASSVVRILQTEYKMNPARMTASGHGEYMPLTSNSTVEGRALNRRTRIIILPQLDQFFKLLVTSK
jgi:chemotaxis protein MotB